MGDRREILNKQIIKVKRIYIVLFIILFVRMINILIKYRCYLNMHDIISRKIIQRIEMSGITSIFGKCVFVWWGWIGLKDIHWQTQNLNLSKGRKAKVFYMPKINPN